MEREGNIDTDKPKFIVSAEVLDSKEKVLNCEIVFHEKVGLKLLNSKVDSKTLRIKAPVLLVDFLLAHAVFPDESEQ